MLSTASSVSFIVLCAEARGVQSIFEWDLNGNVQKTRDGRSAVGGNQVQVLCLILVVASWAGTSSTVFTSCVNGGLGEA